MPARFKPQKNSGGVPPFERGNESFRAEVRRFVAREITPRVAAWERAGRFPAAATRACGRRGYLALAPDRAAILAEELPQCESLGVALGVFVQAGLVAPLLQRLGSERLHEQVLRGVHGGRTIGAMAVTEPHAGSDIAAMKATATLARGRRGPASTLLLEGEKTYVTCAAAADVLIVAARVREHGKIDADPTLFLVPTGVRGVRVTPLSPMGLGTTAMGRVTLRRCRLSIDSQLGARGRGYEAILAALDGERLYGGLGAVAWAQRAIEKTIAFLRERRAFGKPISRHQAVRHQLADCVTALAAARQLNYAAYARWASREGGGPSVTRDIAMVKLFTYDQVQRTIALCLQLHGGLGYMSDHWTAQWYRDARALTIAAGTPEVMRDLIAAHLRL
jgi:alkylation response protein AidB-like acyl-CoA dehydrogenase